MPFYLFLAVVIIREYKRQNFYIFTAIALLITLCDQTASHLIKNLVKRLRPSHEPSLENIIHLSQAGKGGEYGFISSYSTNAFGLATFLILLLPSKYNWLKLTLIIWVFLVCYSRIYNGVHYPSDVIVAMFLGITYGFLVKHVLLKLHIFYKKNDKFKNDRQKGQHVTAV